MPRSARAARSALSRASFSRSTFKVHQSQACAKKPHAEESSGACERDSHLPPSRSLAPASLPYLGGSLAATPSLSDKLFPLARERPERPARSALSRSDGPLPPSPHLRLPLDDGRACCSALDRRRRSAHVVPTLEARAGLLASTKLDESDLPKLVRTRSVPCVVDETPLPWPPNVGRRAVKSTRGGGKISAAS